MSAAIKSKLKAQFDGLDPVLLLRDVRAAQQVLSDLAAREPLDRTTLATATDMPTFLDSLATAWKDRLAQIVPDAYASNAQLRTLQRRIKA